MTDVAEQSLPTEAYCLSCRTRVHVLNPAIVPTKNGRNRLTGICNGPINDKERPACGKKVSNMIKVSAYND